LSKSFYDKVHCHRGRKQSLNSENFLPVTLPSVGPSVLACGAWLKNTVCVTRGNKAYVSPLIGDLDNAAARQKLDATVALMCQQYDIQPEAVSHDLHPDFYSTQFAHGYAEQHHVPAIGVQHHHAHIAAICAEHRIAKPVLGLALDGVGLGSDNTPWGGELLLVRGADYQRLGHLAPLAMPGGDRAAREPWRMAAAVLFQLGRGDEIVPRFANQSGSEMVATMLERNFNCPTTSSMGRLFDAVAGLLAVNTIQSYEAQAAIQLQQLAEQYGQIDPLKEGYSITENNVLDFSPLLAALIEPQPVKTNTAQNAAIFHATLAAGLAEWVGIAASKQAINQIALGGGCFHNTILSRELIARLHSQALRVITAQQMPPNDSAISLGQAWVAMQQRSQ
jgi:hydrogenase maturation factor HypF (carbamoyltransferase family)